MAVIGGTQFLERLQFFNGQRLFAGDLQALEAFNREMRWLHNQSLHQAGVGSGYAVSGAKGDREVIITPGYAIDACGHEIVLTWSLSRRWPTMEPATRSSMILRSRIRMIAICLNLRLATASACPLALSDCGKRPTSAGSSWGQMASPWTHNSSWSSNPACESCWRALKSRIASSISPSRPCSAAMPARLSNLTSPAAERTRQLQPGQSG